MVELAEAPTSGKNVFFTVTIEGQPAGRIVVQLFDDPGIASQRFRDLAVGKGGVGYRLNRIDGIFETHLRVEGVKSLSYSATGESFIAGADSLAELRTEMALSTRKHDAPALVSLIVEEVDDARPITEKFVARDGKFITVQMQAGEAPNGTAFVITRGPAPDLDRTNLVVGKVVEGMDLVETVAALPFSKPRVEWYDGPFFEAGKAMGDKRAVVAEKGFNRPFKRVIIKKAGLVGDAAPDAAAL
ncbi:hypothetical protein FOA52_001852 [Chlamydomonas sp. UWO 241]|nr:hypothetical protein FOA52_001852 [Chlamydomonas sp. UWO 241]